MTKLIANTRPNKKGTYFAPKVGDFLSETLVTDSRAYVVVAVTEKTIKVVPAGHGEVVKRQENGSPYPIVWSEIVAPENTSKAKAVRLRKDGTLRLGTNPLYPATIINGTPATRTDYSY